MRITDYVYVPQKIERSTGEHVVHNAFYMPDSNAHENRDIYKGYNANDLLELEIQKIVPLDENLVKAFDW